MQQSIQLITYKTIKYAYVRAELTPMESTYHLYIIKVNDILGSRRQEENKNFYIVLQVSLNGSDGMEVLIEGLIEVFGEIFLEIIAALIGTFFDYLNENSKVNIIYSSTPSITSFDIFLYLPTGNNSHLSPFK